MARCAACDRGMGEARALLDDAPSLLDALAYRWLQEFVVRKLLWVLSEGASGPSERHKYFEVPYRSVAAQESTTTSGLRHEHVVTLKWAIEEVIRDPANASVVASRITSCLVTAAEAVTLNRSKREDWERYREVRIAVIDASKPPDDERYWVVLPVGP